MQSPRSLGKCSIAVTELFSAALLSDCSRKRALLVKIEFINFLNKSSSSRSNLRTFCPLKKLGNFGVGIYFAPFCSTNSPFCIRFESLIVFLFTPLNFATPRFEIIFWRQTNFGHDQGSGQQPRDLLDVTHWVSECWGCQQVAYAGSDWMEKVPTARQCKHESSFAIELHSHACPATTAPTGCRNENDELVKRCKTYGGWRGSPTAIHSCCCSPFQFEECPQHRSPLLTLSLQILFLPRLQSPKNCSWSKNRVAAVRQLLSRHWYDWENWWVQYYAAVPLQLASSRTDPAANSGCRLRPGSKLQRARRYNSTAGAASKPA